MEGTQPTKPLMCPRVPSGMTYFFCPILSYNHQKTSNHQKSLKTMDRIPPQHIPETANRFEMLNNLSTDIVNHKSENKSAQEASEYVSL
jgi:hypothetical protein